jgi:branched-chain amino acid transport system substrate-binding protein
MRDSSDGVELIRHDDGGRPDAAAVGARRLVEMDRVSILAGGNLSATAAAVAAYAGQQRVPFIVLNTTNASLTQKSPFAVRTSVTVRQTSFPLGAWAARQGWRRGFTIVSDSPWGHDAEEAFARGLVEQGGQIVGSERIPLTEGDIAAPLLRARDVRPDVLFTLMPSAERSATLVKAYDRLGLKRDGIHLVGPQDIATDDALEQMGESASGLITSGFYSSTGRRPQNTDFLLAWQRAFGDRTLPDFMSVAGWDGMAAAFDVFRRTKGRFTGDQAMEVLRGWTTRTSPRGPMVIDPETRETIQNIYLRRIEFVDRHPTNVEFETIPMVDAVGRSSRR